MIDQSSDSLEQSDPRTLTSRMGKISNDVSEGLGVSLGIYMTAIAVAVLILGTPVYLITKPTRFENPGMAAYKAPPGTRLIPEFKPPADIAQDASDQPQLAAAKVARR